MATNKKTVELIIEARDEFSKAFDGLNNELKGIEKQLDQLNKGTKESGDGIRNALLGAVVGGNLLAAGLQHAFGLIKDGAKALAEEIKRDVDVAAQLQATMLGLQSVAMAYGKDADEVVEASKRLASDGLLAPAEAAEALKNTLAALPHLTLQQAEAMVGASKETAAFNRVLNDYGDAVIQTSRGLRNRNSILTDSAGIQKNLSIIMKEAGFDMQDLDSATEGASAQQALFEGWMRESAFAMGDLSTYLDTYQGKLAGVDATVANLRATIGEIFMPAFEEATEVQGRFLAGLNEFFEENKGRLQNLVQMIVDWVVGAFQELGETFHWTKGMGDSTIIPLINGIIDGFIQMGNVLKIVANIIQTGIDTIGTGLANFFDIVHAGIAGLKGDLAGAKQQFDEVSGRTTQWANNVMDNNNDIMDAVRNLSKTTTFDIKTAWNGLSNDFKQTSLGMKDAVVNDFNEMSDKAQKALEKMQDAIEKANQSYQNQLDSRQHAFEEQLTALVFRHREAQEKLRNDIKQETRNFENEMAKRKQAYAEAMAKISGDSEERKQSVIDKFEEETRQIKINLMRQLGEAHDSDVTLIQLAKNTIEEKERERDKELAKISADADAELADLKKTNDEKMADLTQTHQEKMDELNKQLEKELEIQAKHSKDFMKLKDKEAKDDITLLKEKHKYQLEELKKYHEQRLEEIKKQYEREQKAAAGKKTSTSNSSVDKYDTKSNFQSSVSGDSYTKYLDSLGYNYTPAYFTPAPKYATGGMVPGIGAKPAVVHGGEMILTPSQTKGVLQLLENFNNMQLKNNQEGFAQTNNIVMEVKGDYDIDSLVRRLAFRYKAGGK